MSLLARLWAAFDVWAYLGIGFVVAIGMWLWTYSQNHRPSD